MLADAVPRLRWRLCHGQTERALTLIGDLLAGLDASLEASLEAASSPPARTVATLRRALETYVAGQADLIIDDAAPDTGASPSPRRPFRWAA